MKRVIAIGCGLVSLSLILAAVQGCSTPDEPVVAPDPATRLELAQGQLIGTRGRDNAMAWYGIPYAQPPLGALRWKAPRPPLPWQGELEALDRSSRCVQFTSEFEPGYDDGELAGDEDCLHLNVWAPAQPSTEPLPVMFWVHGGANVWGYAGQYELGRMAQQEQLVIVSTNYRLGPLGWLAHQSLRQTATTPLDRSANFGTLDLVAALDWVGDNIHAFGGDPGNITVFGESAGGFNTASLLASPLAVGKFHKAIIQSGGFRSATLAAAEEGPKPGQTKTGVSANELIMALRENGELDAEALSPEDVAVALRGIPVEMLMERFKAIQEEPSLMGGINVIDQIRDGVALPDKGLEAAFQRIGKEEIPVILGSNHDEARLLGMADEELVNSIWIIAFWPKDADYYRAHGEYPSRMWGALGVAEPAHRLIRSGGAPVYTYRFDWDEQGRALFTDVSELIGASHALEIGFVTGGFDDRINDPLGVYFSEDNEAGRQALSDAMMSYWAEFAYNGNPGKGRDGKLPTWLPFDPAPGQAKTLILDTPSDGGIRMTGEGESSEEVLRALAEDSRMDTPAQRCKVATSTMLLVNTVSAGSAALEDLATSYCEDSE